MRDFLGIMDPAEDGPTLMNARKEQELNEK